VQKYLGFPRVLNFEFSKIRTLKVLKLDLGTEKNPEFGQFLREKSSTRVVESNIFKM